MVVSHGRLPSESSVRIHANTGLDPDAIGPDQRDRRDRRLADLSSQPRNVVEDRVGRRIEHLILIEGLNSESFVFDKESIHLTFRW